MDYCCPYCSTAMPSGAEVSTWAHCGEIGHAVEMLPTCPKCGAEDAMESRRHRFSTERGPNVPDADWDECNVCGYQTDPE